MMSGLETTTPEDVHAFCKWIIGGMAGFIVSAGYAAYSWIKDILKQLADERAGRLTDLKEHYNDLKEAKS